MSLKKAINPIHRSFENFIVSYPDFIESAVTALQMINPDGRISVLHTKITHSLRSNLEEHVIWLERQFSLFQCISLYVENTSGNTKYAG